MKCDVHNNIWGKLGSKSLVARLWENQSADFHIDEDKPYAELWIGSTHPNGMSTIILTSQAKDTPYQDEIPLLAHVQNDAKLHLGMTQEGTKQSDLTFLFKVLSIGKTLAIQAHPDKSLATQLHKERPSVYKDSNHKPEMAVSICDDFEALVGFRPISELVDNLKKYPEFLEVVSPSIGPDNANNEKGAHIFDNDDDHDQDPKLTLKDLMHRYMTADELLVRRQLNCLVEKLHKKHQEGDIMSSLDALIMKLSQQYPGDRGAFGPILFNHLKLKKGEAVYIDANEPHAYIQGDILECMACSDNVVRAGLSNKLKDTDTLVQMLTYNNAVPKITRGVQIDMYTTLFAPPPPVNDFAMEVIQIPSGSRYILKRVQSPSVLLILEGSATLWQMDGTSLHVSFGHAAFMSVNTTATVITGEGGDRNRDQDQGVMIVRALKNVYI